jgi:WD40 repeat protein
MTYSHHRLHIQIALRHFIASYSFERAQLRIATTHRVRSSEKDQLVDDAHTAELYRNSREIALNGTEFADERPASCLRYSANGDYLASGSFGSAIKVWDSRSLKLQQELRGHEERVTSIAWHPNQDMLNLALSSADGCCIIWYILALSFVNLFDAKLLRRLQGEDKLQLRLRGHQG